MIRKKIAIIGAGLSGAILAQELSQFFDVVIFEKSRGIGGRTSSRRKDEFSFDHGAQAFCVRSKKFKDYLKSFIDTEIIAPWRGKIAILESDKTTLTNFNEEHFVACPTMNSLTKAIINSSCHNSTTVSACQSAPPICQSAPPICHPALVAGSITTNLNYKVEILSFKNQKWQINNAPETFDFLISTAPSAQTQALMQNFLPAENLISQTQMHACFSLMLGFDEKINLSWIFAKVKNSPIKLISLNSSKPQRSCEKTCFVAQTKNSYSNKNLNKNPEEIKKELIAEFEKLTKINCQKAAYQEIHLWRYALVKKSLINKNYCNFSLNFAATSDWTSNSRIEEVFLSAKNLSKKLISKLS
jgi:predicted NAD/FAD-dependent oxidoreductase